VYENTDIRWYYNITPQITHMRDYLGGGPVISVSNSLFMELCFTVAMRNVM